jgi:hypothetical protein
MTPILITSLPYDRMRYPTLGDWYYSLDIDTGDKRLQIITASTDETGAPVSEQEQFLIALHELVEVKLCEARGITQKAVDDFDLAYAGLDEPGDEPLAPYRREHRFAMLIEHQMAHELGMVGYGEVR